MSIFQKLTKSCENFFKQIPISNRKTKSSHVEFKDFLYFSYNGEEPSPKEVSLIKSKIYFYTSCGALIEFSLKWCIFRAFVEESQLSEKKFGFKIESYGQAYDFYTENEEKLQLWMEKMPNNVIFTEFDNDFVVIKPLASGSHGEVFLCQDIRTRQEFAVKKVKKSRLAQIKSLNSLFNEISIQRKIDHNNIVKLFKVYEEVDSLCLVLEYIKHGTLLDRMIKVRVFDECNIVAFIRKFILVLGYLHSIGIIHRDLKPDNILMSTRDDLCDFKIADFGLSCMISNYDCTCSGSPGYMAPEMLKNSQYTNKIDMFSAGIIFYILFTGIVPFSGSSTKQILSKNKNCQINFKLLDNYASASIKSLLKQMLDPNPNRRPSSDEILKNSSIFGNNSEDIYSIDLQDSNPDYENLKFSELAHNYS